MCAKHITIDILIEKLFEVHGSTVSIKPDTFINKSSHATFVDKDFGEWQSQVKAVLKGSRHPKRWANLRSFSLDKIKEKIQKTHGNTIKIKEDTYTKLRNRATFIDKDFGEWICTAILVLRGGKHPQRANLEHRVAIEKIRDRIQKIHGNTVSICESSYVMVAKKAIFEDLVFGKFEALVNSVLCGTGHPKRRNEKSEKTCLKKYGVKNASQDPVISLKAAKKTNVRHLRYHWKNSAELVCQASWESRVVDYLNSKRINFVWQPRTFILPCGKTYRPDLLLTDSNTWVEIKGWMREKSQLKWDWFKTQFPSAELWDKKKLKEMGIL